MSREAGGRPRGRSWSMSRLLRRLLGAFFGLAVVTGVGSVVALAGLLAGLICGRRGFGGEGLGWGGGLPAGHLVLHDVRFGALLGQPVGALGLALLGQDGGLDLSADVLEGTHALWGALGHQDHVDVAHAVVSRALRSVA